MAGIGIVDRHIDFMLPASLAFQIAQFAGEREVKAVVVGITALIASAIVHGICLSINGVLSVWESDRLTCVVNPIGGKANTRRDIVTSHNDKIVRAVVRRAILPAMADVSDSAERA